MPTQYKRVEIPMPRLGMNTDASPSQIGPDYCQYSNNIIATEPGQLRTRRGWAVYDRHSNAFGTAANGDIFGMAVLQYSGNAYVLLGLIENEDSYAGGGLAGGTHKVRQLSVPGGVSTPNATAFGKLFPWATQYVNYDNSVYFIGQDTTGSAGARLCRWGASGNADITSGGITINNGATSGTLGTSVGATQLGGMYICVTGGATGPGANYRYVYRIRSGSGTSITLATPYGYGESTTNVPNAASASTTISIRAITEVPYCPTGSFGGVALYRDRLFTGGGYTDVAGTDFAYNIIHWSKPGELEKWPSANYAYVGSDNDPITAFGNVPNGLLIFTATKTFLLTGYDESSFTLTQISGQIGCTAAHTVTYADDRCYWMNGDGIYTSNGSEPVSITQPSPGRGVKTHYLSKYHGSTTTRNTGTPPMSGMGIAGDYLLASFSRPEQGANNLSSLMAHNLRTGAWTEWGATSKEYNPLFYFHAINGQTYGVGVYNTVNVTDCFAQEEFGDNLRMQTDQHYDTSGAVVTTAVAAQVIFADLRVGADAVRLRGIQFEHNCHYYNSTSSPRVAWAVTIDTDQNIDNSPTTVGNIDARYVGNLGAPQPDKYFTTTFRDTSLEGAAFRLALTKTASTDSAKIFRAYLLLDPQPITVSRVDTPTL